MPFYVSYQTEINQLKKENENLKKPKFDKWLRIISICGSIFVFYFGFLQFLSNQSMMDKRKYNNFYYDERYRVLKEVTKSISEINILITYCTKEKLDSSELKGISRNLIALNYAYLILDEHKKMDSIVLNNLNEYRNLVFMKSSMGYADLVQLDSIGRKTIIQIGNIINHEKDTINSFKFKFWPF